MKWLHFILSHSIFIAVCAVALAFQTSELLQTKTHITVYGFIFFATLCSYNFYWLLSKFSFAGTGFFRELLRKELPALCLMFISAAGISLCLFYAPLRMEHVITAVLLTVAYAIPLLPFTFLRFTRRAGVLKTTLLAFTWAYVTAFLPLEKTYAMLDSADVFILTRRFLFMLMLCIIFDSRDIAVDKIRGLRSLATDLHPATLQILIYTIFIIMFATNFLSTYFGISSYQSIALQTSTIALLVVYFYSTKKQDYLFYYFVVDGLMLFSALTTFIAGI
jgi:hypothetical protein